MNRADRTFWLGAACAIAVLVIWTSFILIARLSAKGHLNPFDIAYHSAFARMAGHDAGR